MHTVLRLGFSSPTELEWDSSKRLTQQACSFYPAILANSVLCAHNAYRDSILLSHFVQKVSERGVKKWLGGSVGGGGRRRKRRTQGERKKELEERWEGMREKHRGEDVDGKIQPCSSVGGLHHSNALSE